MMAKWMEYYVDCQVPLECRKNVIKTQKTLIRAWYVNSWEAVLVSDVQILLSHSVKKRMIYLLPWADQSLLAGYLYDFQIT